MNDSFQQASLARQHRSAVTGVVLGVLAFGVLIIGLVNEPAVAPTPYQCPRTVEGGWELVAFKVAQDGHQYDCRFVKRGVR